MDEDGRGVPDTLVEIWQANACGRYTHVNDQHPAPLDPNFTGCGRVATDAKGTYKFVTVKPGAYPWMNHHNAWRPAHIHLLAVRPVLHVAAGDAALFPRRSAVLPGSDLQFGAGEKARGRMICKFDLEHTVPEWALAYRFDIVLRGRNATPLDDDKH